MRLDGTGVRRITRDGGRDEDPSWSPDGRRLLWAGKVDTATGAEIYRGSAVDGIGVVRLTRNALPDSDRTYSPNGRWIALTSFCRPASARTAGRSGGSAATGPTAATSPAACPPAGA